MELAEALARHEELLVYLLLCYIGKTKGSIEYIVTFRPMNIIHSSVKNLNCWFYIAQSDIRQFESCTILILFSFQFLMKIMTSAHYLCMCGFHSNLHVLFETVVPII